MALNENRLDVAERLLKPHLKEDPFDASRDPHARRACGAHRTLERCREFASPGGRDRAGLHGRAEQTSRLSSAGPAGRRKRSSFSTTFSRSSRRTSAMLNLQAATLGKLGDFEQAIQLYEMCFPRRPKQPRVWLSYGHMLKTVGRQAEALPLIARRCKSSRRLGEAWWSLANLKTVKFDEADIAAMEQALSSARPVRRGPLPSRFRAGQGDARSRDGRDEAFAHYCKANALRLKMHPYRFRRC